MDERLKSIMSRRSIRAFTKEPVGEDVMKEILAAGLCAPSACARFPARFIVLDRSRMRELAGAVAQKAPFEQGRWAIAVCADTRGYEGGVAWIEDCAAAMENMQIAAFALGLGALWYGVYRRAAKEPQVRAVLKLPEGVEVLGVAVFGHAAEHKEPNVPDESRVRYGVWSDER